MPNGPRHCGGRFLLGVMSLATDPDPEVDAFAAMAKGWQAELAFLRPILRDCGLTEAIKWRQPCYSVETGNVAIFASMKDCCGIGFFKGVLLRDPEGVLVRQGENSQSSRLMRFTSLDEVRKSESTILAYVAEAIANEVAGLKVDFKEKHELVYPEELIQKLESDPAFEEAFERLTPGKKRGYNLHFSAAKNAATRISRIEAMEARILAGKGFHDCICGLSKKLPRCDGSHKKLKRSDGSHKALKD